jgi:hypothetical protein
MLVAPPPPITPAVAPTHALFTKVNDLMTHNGMGQFVQDGLIAVQPLLSVLGFGDSKKHGTY